MSKQELLIPPTILELPPAEKQAVLATLRVMYRSEFYRNDAGIDPEVHPVLEGFCFSSDRSKAIPVFRHDNGLVAIEHDSENSGVTSWAVKESDVYRIR